jgi:hypothetical protein
MTEKQRRRRIPDNTESARKPPSSSDFEEGNACWEWQFHPSGLLLAVSAVTPTAHYASKGLLFRRAAKFPSDSVHAG